MGILDNDYADEIAVACAGVAGIVLAWRGNIEAAFAIFALILGYVFGKSAKTIAPPKRSAK